MLPTVFLCLTNSISRILLKKTSFKKTPVKIYVFYLSFHNYIHILFNSAFSFKSSEGLYNKKWTDNNKENPELANSHICLTTTLCFSSQEHSILRYVMNMEQFYKILVSVLQDYLKEIFQLLGQSAVISMKSHTAVLKWFLSPLHCHINGELWGEIAWISDIVYMTIGNDFCGSINRVSRHAKTARN